MSSLVVRCSRTRSWSSVLRMARGSEMVTVSVSPVRVRI